MSSAREVIAKGLFAHVKPFGQSECEAYAKTSLNALTTAGYRIIGPDELDDVTLERAASEATRVSQRDYSASYRAGACDSAAAIRSLKGGRS